MKNSVRHFEVRLELISYPSQGWLICSLRRWKASMEGYQPSRALRQVFYRLFRAFSFLMLPVGFGTIWCYEMGAINKHEAGIVHTSGIVQLKFLSYVPRIVPVSRESWMGKESDRTIPCIAARSSERYAAKRSRKYDKIVSRVMILILSPQVHT